jgi:proteasome lid subunit RPN8/RPN11
MRISDQLIDRVRAEAAAVAPKECCGLLLSRDEEEICAIEPYPGPLFENRFVLSDDWLLQQHYRCKRGGIKVVGYYHSHPSSSPKPSKRDLHEHPPGSLGLIVGKNGAVELFFVGERERADR